MRYWSYNEPIWDDDGNITGDEVITKSEEDIIREYYPYWMARMVEKFGLAAFVRNYTKQDCIDDWLVVNWAWEVPNEN